MKNTPQQLHISVLLPQTVALLAPKVGESYLDLTAGYGGHAGAILEKTGAPHKAVLVDRDEHAIATLDRFTDQGATLLHLDFHQAAKQLAESNKKFDMILIDLGVSSPQLDRPERGFSFMHAGPLDMRMDNRESRTAADLVNESSEDMLFRIIREYGEEPHARAIARAIVAHRPYSTTDQLAGVIERTIGRRGKHHPATRTFQALRIALNRELELLEQTLPVLVRLLAPKGRLAVISFHSLEDRIVKRFFAEHTKVGYESDLVDLTKKPISGATEDVNNPRARSAKLRAVANKK